MARGNTRSRSNEDSDPGTIVLQAQKRILQLKKERDERIRAIVAESDAALAGLRAKVVAYQEESLRQRGYKRAQAVMKLIEVLEQKRDVEMKTVEIAIRMNSLMNDLEEMMMIGYLGRERDAISANDALRRHSS